VGYYRGDGSNYYRGDYYQGDPFIGAALGFVGKKVAAPLVKKAGAWVGRQTVGGLIGKTAATAAGTVAAGKVVQAARGGGEIVIDPISMAPGGAPGMRIVYPTKRRRMNVMNPRALKRALRRAEGFEKIARRTVNALRAGPKKFKSTTRKRS
jgi:hypothetical protein